MHVVCRSFGALECRVVVVVPDIIVEDIVYKQRQSAFIFAETVADACHRHQFVSVHLGCGIALAEIVGQTYVHFEWRELERDTHSQAVVQRTAVVGVVVVAVAVPLQVVE